MRLKRGNHLAYCTNIHRGEAWDEIFTALREKTLAVRERVCPGAAYAIGLRLGVEAVRDLSQPATLAGFRRWLDANGAYVFTINGFPYGRFHGTRVKEDVYRPDWTTPERLDYTNQLFDLLAQIVPDGMEGSVSTVPCSFRAFIQEPRQEQALRDNLWRCVEHIARVSDRTGKRLHLGLEPEPLCYLETSQETVDFFERLRADRPGDARLDEHLGVNYDTCHLAVEFEEPGDVLRRFREHGVRLSKLHFSAALKVQPTPEVREALPAFADEVYFHQVVARQPAGTLRRFRDLPDALAAAEAERIGAGADGVSANTSPVSGTPEPAEEWRIHFHVPLHSAPSPLFRTTADHLLGVMDALAAEPSLCSHLEMETYTWEVLPGELKQRDVVDQLAAEYAWTLGHLRQRGLA